MNPWALVLATALAACGSVDHPPADARPDRDAPLPPDASPGAPDAVPSSVMIVSCAGQNPAATIGTSGFAFSPPTATINVGDVLRFTPSGLHNMTSGVPGAPDVLFQTPTQQEACLRFSRAGSFPFFCSVHPSMVGVVTVN